MASSTVTEQSEYMLGWGDVLLAIYWADLLFIAKFFKRGLHSQDIL